MVPEVQGQKAEWGDVRVDPAVGSWYRDDRRCQLTLKELGRQKGAGVSWHGGVGGTQGQGSKDARRQGDEFCVSLQVTLVQAEVMQAVAVWGELCFPPSQAEALKGGI